MKGTTRGRGESLLSLLPHKGGNKRRGRKKRAEQGVNKRLQIARGDGLQRKEGGTKSKSMQPNHPDSETKAGACRNGRNM